MKVNIEIAIIISFFKISKFLKNESNRELTKVLNVGHIHFMLPYFR